MHGAAEPSDEVMVWAPGNFSAAMAGSNQGPLVDQQGGCGPIQLYL